jgi:hypothetical protein
MADVIGTGAAAGFRAAESFLVLLAALFLATVLRALVLRAASLWRDAARTFLRRVEETLTRAAFAAFFFRFLGLPNTFRLSFFARSFSAMIVLPIVRPPALQT